MTWGRSTTSSPVPAPIKPRSRAHSFFLPSRARRLNAGGAAIGPVPAMPTESSPSLTSASTSYTTTTERNAEHDAQQPQSPWWPDAVRVKPRHRSAHNAANNHGRTPSSLRRGEADEFTCCGLSASPEGGNRADDNEALRSPDRSVTGSATLQEHAPISYLHRPDDAFHRAAHPNITSKPVTIPPEFMDPLGQFYHHDEDSLDMADLLDNTLIPMVMSPYLPRTVAMSPGSSASTFEASPRTPTVSPPFRTSAMPVPPPLPLAESMTASVPLERSARHARSMPSLGLAFRSARRKRPVGKGESTESAGMPQPPTATGSGATSINISALPSIVSKRNRELQVGGAVEQQNALQLVMGPPAQDAIELAPAANPHRLRRPTEAPALSQTSPLRARRHKPPLTIAPHSVAAAEALSTGSDAGTPLLSPGTPSSGTLRARRSKASLKLFTVSSPPPCPPPTTPLPQLPGTPIVISATRSDGHQQPERATARVTAIAVPAAVAPDVATESVPAAPAIAPSTMSGSGHASIGMREAGRALSTASSSSAHSKATHSSPHFSMRSYESYQTSPASVTKVDITTQQPQQPQLMAMTGQQIRQLNRQSFRDRYTPRSSIGLRDSRQSLTSLAMLVGDESTMASNGNHASLSKSAMQASGSDRSSISSVGSGVAAINESARRKSVTLADSASQGRRGRVEECDIPRSNSRSKVDGSDESVIGLAF